MMGLLVFKEKLRRFYAKYNIYIMIDSLIRIPEATTQTDWRKRIPEARNLTGWLILTP